MLDFGWSELFLIIVLAIVLLGPKDIPEIVYQFGRLVRRIQYMKFAVSQQFNDFMEKSDLHELRKGGALGIGELDPRTILSQPYVSARGSSRSGSLTEGGAPEAGDHSQDKADMNDMDEDESYHHAAEIPGLSMEQNQHDTTISKHRND